MGEGNLLGSEWLEPQTGPFSAGVLLGGDKSPQRKAGVAGRPWRAWTLLVRALPHCLVPEAG